MWTSNFFTLSLRLVFVTLFLHFQLAAAEHHGRRHYELARRIPGDIQLHKREFFGCRFTYYDVGLDSCGYTDQPSDFIVAMSVIDYGDGYPGPYCDQMITIQVGDKQAQAKVHDKCMGCPHCGLDFSEGLFEYFAELEVGVLNGNWWFNTDPPSAPTPTSTYVPPPPPPPTSTYVPPPPPPPTSTYVPPPPPPPPTSTYVPPPPPTTRSTKTTSITSYKPPPPTTTSTSSKSSSSSLTTSSSKSSSTSTSTSTYYSTASVNLNAGPVANIAAVEGVTNAESGVVGSGNIAGINQALINLAAVAAAAQTSASASD